VDGNFASAVGIQDRHSWAVGAAWLRDVSKCCNAEWCLRAEFRDMPQVTEREGEGERPRSQVPENAQVGTGRSVDASVLVLSIGVLT